jgi:hypothetical protein
MLALTVSSLVRQFRLPHRSDTDSSSGKDVPRQFASDDNEQAGHASAFSLGRPSAHDV